MRLWPTPLRFDIQAVGIAHCALHVYLLQESSCKWFFFWPKVFEHISFLGKKQKNILNSLVLVIFVMSTKEMPAGDSFRFDWSGLKFVSLEHAVSLMVLCIFIGQGPFCLHMPSLGNKGQWVVLEIGQMAGFFPGSRLLDPHRLAPGCPAAGLSGSLLDD